MLYRPKTGSHASPFPIVPRPYVVLVFEEVYLPYSLTGAFGVVFKELVPFTKMHGYRSLHFFFRLIVRIVDHSFFHSTENCLDDIQELSARGERDEPDNRARAVCVVPSVEVVGPLHQLIRSVPGGSIPAQVDSRFVMMLIVKYLDQVDHSR